MSNDSRRATDIIQGEDGSSDAELMRCAVQTHACPQKATSPIKCRPSNGRPLRILHAPTNPCGQSPLSCVGLRALGHIAHCCAAQNRHGQYAYKPDFANAHSLSTWVRRFRLLWYMASYPFYYDVFHFHDACTMLPDRWRYADARLFRRLGKRVFVEFWGSDVRNPVLESQRNPYYVNVRNDDARRSEERLKRWASVTNGHVIISDHWFDAMLRPHFPHIHVVRQRIDINFFQPHYPGVETKKPLLVHAPSDRAYKGTIHVNKAVDRLKKRGLPFEYVEVYDMPQKKALPIFRKADLIVDQLCGGAHGVFAVEAMALGKPVICHILPELVSTYPSGFPIINANPDTIEEVLADWIQRPEDRHGLGIRSREYAEHVHDCRVVGARLVKAYESQK